MTTTRKAAAPKLAAADKPATTTVITTEGTREVPAGPVEPETLTVVVTDNNKFKDLETDELRAIALFFVKDVDADANRAEVLAALASQGDDGDAPVTWADYETLFLSAQPPKVVAVPQAPAGKPVVDLEEEDNLFIIMERSNPRFDIAGYTFTTEHPFNAVPAKTAEYIAKQPGFRLALPSEIQEYYS